MNRYLCLCFFPESHRSPFVLLKKGNELLQPPLSCHSFKFTTAFYIIFLKYISIMKAMHSDVDVVVIHVFFYILYNGHGNS